MESYEEFCLRSLVRLQAERQPQRTGGGWKTRRPQEGASIICFHGRTVLSPLLTEEQRREMAGHRQRAVQLEVDRQTLHRSSLLARVQDILDHVQQMHKVPDMEMEKQPPTPPHCRSPKHDTVNGYTLVTDSPGVPGGGGVQGKPDTVNGYTLVTASSGVPGGSPGVQEPAVERPTSPGREPPAPLDGCGGEREAEEEQEEEEGGGRVVREEEAGGEQSLQSLLRRSREYVEAELSRRGSKGGGRVARTPPPPDSLSDKENEGRSPQGAEPGYALRHSPLSPSQSQYQAACDSYTQQHSCLSPGLPDPYPRLPAGPEPSLSPRPPHPRRPRPVSAGNIVHVSFPVGPADLIPRGRGAASGEGSSAGAGLGWGGLVAGSGGSSSSSRRAGGASLVRETGGPVGASAGPGAPGYDVVSPRFRRRCHTLDSQLHPSTAGAIDRSQERLPRFMGGVARLAPPPSRAAAPLLNQSYEVESPAPSLLRPRVTPDPSPGHMRAGLEAEGPQGSHNGRLTPTAHSQALEGPDSKTEETQRRVQALEDMQRRLEEEHALQMSLLIAEQEKEQQRLCQELDEKERSLREQGCDWRSVTDGYAALGPASCPARSPAYSPAERSPGHGVKIMGFPPPLLSGGASSPSGQPPVYLGGHTWGGSKSRARLSQSMNPEQQRALCRLGAVTRGFLTRRLLRIEKVKHLRQTVQDTQEFIRSFQTEAPQKRGSITSQDLSLQDRVRAQLRAALYDVHDIFFSMPLAERLALLRQDRELRAERRLREMEKAKSPKDKMTLSAATQRSLDRKKRVGESPGQARKVGESPGQARKVGESPGQARKVGESPGQARKVGESPGQARKVGESPGQARKVGESPGQARKVQQKPKSPPANRILKPSQGQNAPVPGQFNRQGSWYRKTPGERLRCSDSLKKQHSLG